MSLVNVFCLKGWRAMGLVLGCLGRAGTRTGCSEAVTAAGWEDPPVPRQGGLLWKYEVTGSWEP